MPQKGRNETMAKQEMAADSNGEFLAKGVNGQLLVKRDRVVIIRKGLMAFATQGLKGDKEIPYTSITAIQFKRSGMTRGYIQFTVPGGNEHRGGVLSSGQDENTVMFADNAAFEFAKSLIEQYQQAMRAPAPQAAAPSAADELAKFAALRDSGVISQEDFEAKKRQLLGI
jgi:hypothetical protein